MEWEGNCVYSVLRMRCVLFGNYGVENLGDEALRSYFLQYFPEVEWKVVTATGEYPRLPMGLRSLFRPWWRTLKAIRECDAVVFGGGSLFTDAESWKAPILWWWYALVAKFHGKKIVLAFQGIGPVRSFVAKRCTGLALLWSSFISVRDPDSFKRVQAFFGESAPKNTIVVQTFDPAIAIFKGTLHQSTKKLIIVPRSNTTLEFLSRVQVEVAKGWDEVVVLLLEPGKDQAAAEKVRAIVKNVAVRSIDVRTFEVLVTEVSSAQFVLTQRFHGAIAALANGVKFEAVPQAPGDKLDNANSMDPAACFSLLQKGQEALSDFFRKG